MKLKKEFFITLFWKQNKWHRHSVLIHTLKVLFQVIKAGEFRMIPAAILHDVGKPFVAFQDEKDKIDGSYSFTNHEEISYQITKNWPISDYTKFMVRNHYLIRGMEKAKQKGKFGAYRRMKRIFDRLSEKEKGELRKFIQFDDLGK